jgi:hypothetical protein
MTAHELLQSAATAGGFEGGTDPWAGTFPVAPNGRLPTVKSLGRRLTGQADRPYATWLVDDGVPVNMVQPVLGHERSSTTLDLYTRRTDDPSRVLRALDDEDPDDGATSVLVPR